MPDPVDARLLALVAEAGRAAVHEIAARAGMDAREVASRLVALSATGLPLLVGVECDPNGLRAALAPPPPPPPQQQPWGHHPQQPVHGTPSGPYPGASGPYPVQSGPYPVHSGPYPAHPGHTGAHPPHAFPQSTPFPVQQPPQSVPFPAQPQQPVAPADPVLSTWGVPQSSSWARGDQQPATPTGPRTGKIGTTLETIGLEGEQLGIQLVEVVDPADFLFTAAGYRLQEGERAVVVHTELTNRGPIPFASLPDLYLVLITKDGRQVSKAPVSLSSRPPHRIGVNPGETAGGHTVYVLPESTDVVAVKWSARSDDEKRSLTWSTLD
ncbi:AsnC-type helix-turn-helix domain-containing protein [Allokutzneria albata]|uniref:AsnC-type helix-turn-helix domain-containing protein n=1 Tax=Allokutzneria albata TaxID=211114 RepID=A0A1G9X0Y7_ALLAB|nr:AsnC-type helix-turn-helix domain-containing protein [Allokutzneria albata]